MPALPAARLGLLSAVVVIAAVAAPSSAGAGSFGTGPVAFAVSAAPAGLPNVDAAGEPSLGIDSRTGSALFMANTSTYRLHFNDRGSPAVSWSDVSSPYSVFNADPILATDRASGTTLAGGDDTGCSVLSKSTNDGESWSPALPCTGLIDHPTVGLGPFHGPRPAGASGPVAAYYCQQYPLLNQCARSLDGGSTWSPGQTVLGCAGVFGHLKVAPDGTAYVPSRNCSTGSTTGVGGFLSRDNGLTWSAYTIPGAATPDRGFDPSVAVTTTGTVFQAWTRAKTAHPMVAVSTDAASHWSAPVDLAGTVHPSLAGASFSAVVAGGSGRAAVAFLGTRHVPAAGVSPYDDRGAVWDLYVSVTYNGGATWTTTQVTRDPVQRGPIADGGTTSGSARNLLDFIDAGLTGTGRIVVAFADGCIAASHCTDPGATAASSVDAYATVAYQSTGRGLLS